ncbi:MAG: hypothetical protein CL453_00105 [Acidimicrobiaceae bacterium]|nr:hypothetical protein [Acidimicrobiaceae bacterium]|tara:strand:+ start:1041 stop:1850 length:810 start_codon:yes stop_codon:yes gene_type:complete
MAGISKNNPRVRELRKLLRDSKFRLEMQKFAAEGLEALKECVETGNQPLDVFVVNDHPISTQVDLLLKGSEATVWHLEKGIIDSVATTVNPQPVISTFSTIDVSIEELMKERPTFLVYGKEIREPGNAGSLIRSAAAASANGIIFSESSVDLYNPKTIRASAGAIFRIPIVRSMRPSDYLKVFEERSIRSVGLSPNGPLSYLDFDFVKPFVVFLGNESSGLDAETLTQMNQIVRIDMGLGVESLNVSNAASVVLFEARRQRDLYERGTR